MKITCLGDLDSRYGGGDSQPLGNSGSANRERRSLLKVDEDEEKVLESRRRKIQNDGYVQDARSGFCNDQYETWHLVVRMDMEMDPYGMA
ncbi:unnamed protein product [Vicia faba]|uniref:Uncharacterized protein n=1 Tax=Vicia faba TaxID=3906 RepID=A0AAV1AMA1_VICFA|nr:unnamed protein product [Vicia faba]